MNPQKIADLERQARAFESRLARVAKLNLSNSGTGLRVGVVTDSSSPGDDGIFKWKALNPSFPETTTGQLSYQDRTTGVMWAAALDGKKPEEGELGLFYFLNDRWLFCSCGAGGSKLNNFTGQLLAPNSQQMIFESSHENNDLSWTVFDLFLGRATKVGWWRNLRGSSRAGMHAAEVHFESIPSVDIRQQLFDNPGFSATLVLPWDFLILTAMSGGFWDPSPLVNSHVMRIGVIDENNDTHDYDSFEPLTVEVTLTLSGGEQVFNPFTENPNQFNEFHYGRLVKGPFEIDITNIIEYWRDNDVHRIGVPSRTLSLYFTANDRSTWVSPDYDEFTNPTGVWPWANVAFIEEHLSTEGGFEIPEIILEP